jgi:hypothetical protein
MAGIAVGTVAGIIGTGGTAGTGIIAIGVAGELLPHKPAESGLVLYSPHRGAMLGLTVVILA